MPFGPYLNVRNCRIHQINFIISQHFQNEKTPWGNLRRITHKFSSFMIWWDPLLRWISEILRTFKRPQHKCRDLFLILISPLPIRQTPQLLFPLDHTQRYFAHKRWSQQYEWLVGLVWVSGLPALEKVHNTHSGYEKFTWINVSGQRSASRNKYKEGIRLDALVQCCIYISYVNHIQIGISLSQDSPHLQQ